MVQVFRHFQPYEATAYNGSRFDSAIAYHCADAVGIWYRPERADSLRLNAGNPRAKRRRTCGDHKVVITLGIAFTGGKIRHRNSLCLAVNGCYLVLHTNVDIKTVAHHFGSHKKQRVSAADHVAHMIGQSAVGIGDILAAFENDDLTLAVESAQTCGAARAACNAANDYGFSRHFLKPLFTVD